MTDRPKPEFKELLENETVKSKLKRKGGQFKDIMNIQEDFDDPLPDEIMKAFRGEGT